MKQMKYKLENKMGCEVVSVLNRPLPPVWQPWGSTTTDCQHLCFSARRFQVCQGLPHLHLLDAAIISKPTYDICWYLPPVTGTLTQWPLDQHTAIHILCPFYAVSCEAPGACFLIELITCRCRANHGSWKCPYLGLNLTLLTTYTVCSK